MFDSPPEKKFFNTPAEVKVLEDLEITLVDLKLDIDDSEWAEFGVLDDHLFWAGMYCHGTEDLMDEIENCIPVTEDMIVYQADLPRRKIGNRCKCPKRGNKCQRITGCCQL